MCSIRAASAGPGDGAGSCSSSKTEEEEVEAVAAGIEGAVCCAGEDAGFLADGAGVNWRAESTFESAGCAGCCADVETVPADLAASAFRSKPRATRSVPLHCSTLIGLVRTRLAPRRNALATPAWPSTAATVSEL